MRTFSSIAGSNPTAFQAVSFQPPAARMGERWRIGQAPTRCSTSSITLCGSRSTDTRYCAGEWRSACATCWMLLIFQSFRPARLFVQKLLGAARTAPISGRNACVADQSAMGQAGPGLLHQAKTLAHCCPAKISFPAITEAESVG